MNDIFLSEKKNGQTFMPDYMASIVVFGIILTIFLFSWNAVLDNQTAFDREDELRRDAFRTMSFLAETSGYPEDWIKDDNKVQIPGFAVEDNVVSSSRLREFGSFNYSRQKRVLQVPNFYLKFERDEGIVEMNHYKFEFGKKIDNPETVIPVKRRVIIKNQNPCYNDLICAYNRVSGAEDVKYSISFRIEEDSDTIGNSLDSVRLKTDSGEPMFSDTGWENLERAGVDTDQDREFEINLTKEKDDWIIKDDGSGLKIEFGSNYENPEAHDLIYLRFDGVSNPDTGVYDAEIQTSGDGNWQYGSIDIGQNESLESNRTSATMRYVVWE